MIDLTAEDSDSGQEAPTAKRARSGAAEEGPSQLLARGQAGRFPTAPAVSSDYDSDDCDAQDQRRRQQHAAGPSSLAAQAGALSGAGGLGLSGLLGLRGRAALAATASYSTDEDVDEGCAPSAPDPSPPRRGVSQLPARCSLWREDLAVLPTVLPPGLHMQDLLLL